jgi:hypothetical protein
MTEIMLHAMYAASFLPPSAIWSVQSSDFKNAAAPRVDAIKFRMGRRRTSSHPSDAIVAPYFLQKKKDTQKRKGPSRNRTLTIQKLLTPKEIQITFSIMRE